MSKHIETEGEMLGNLAYKASDNGPRRIVVYMHYDAFEGLNLWAIGYGAKYPNEDDLGYFTSEVKAKWVANRLNALMGVK